MNFVVIEWTTGSQLQEEPKEFGSPAMRQDFLTLWCECVMFIEFFQNSWAAGKSNIPLQLQQDLAAPRWRRCGHILPLLKWPIGYEPQWAALLLCTRSGQASAHLWHVPWCCSCRPSSQREMSQAGSAIPHLLRPVGTLPLTSKLRALSIDVTGLWAKTLMTPRETTFVWTLPFPQSTHG